MENLNSNSKIDCEVVPVLSRDLWFRSDDRGRLVFNGYNWSDVLFSVCSVDRPFISCFSSVDHHVTKFVIGSKSAFSSLYDDPYSFSKFCIPLMRSAYSYRVCRASAFPLDFGINRYYSLFIDNNDLPYGLLGLRFDLTKFYLKHQFSE